MNVSFPEIAGADGRMLAVVGIYPTRTEAYDRSLVVLAMEIPHWILRHGEQFALCVEPARAEAVAEELARFETERAVRPPVPEPAPARYQPIEAVNAPGMPYTVTRWSRSASASVKLGPDQCDQKCAR